MCPGKPKDEKRIDKRKRKEQNKMVHEHAKYVRSFQTTSLQLDVQGPSLPLFLQTPKLLLILPCLRRR